MVNSLRLSTRPAFPPPGSLRRRLEGIHRSVFDPEFRLPVTEPSFRAVGDSSSSPSLPIPFSLSFLTNKSKKKKKKVGSERCFLFFVFLTERDSKNFYYNLLSVSDEKRSDDTRA